MLADSGLAIDMVAVAAVGGSGSEGIGVGSGKMLFENMFCLHIIIKVT